MSQKAYLEFVDFGVSKIALERTTSEKVYEFEITIGRGVVDVPDSENTFQCNFLIGLKSKDEKKKFELTFEAFGQFRLIGDPEPKLVEIYKNVNAPAILFPYIRAFLSNLSLGVGINSVIIPPTNFSTTLSKDKAE